MDHKASRLELLLDQVKGKLCDVEADLNSCSNDSENLSIALDSLEEFVAQLKASENTLIRLQKKASTVCGKLSKLPSVIPLQTKTMLSFISTVYYANEYVKSIRSRFAEEKTALEILINANNLSNSIKMSLLSKPQLEKTRDLEYALQELRVENNTLETNKKKLLRKLHSLQSSPTKKEQHKAEPKANPIVFLQKAVTFDYPFEAFPKRQVVFKMKPELNTLLSLDLTTGKASIAVYGTKLPKGFDIAFTTTKVFVTGGRTVETCGYFQVHGSTFELKNMNLIKKEDMLARRWQHKLIALNDNILYAIGGRFESTLDTCEVYDVTKNTWSYTTKLNVGRYQFSGCQFSGKHIYVFGGYKNNDLKGPRIHEPTIENFSTGESRWNLISLAEPAFLKVYNFAVFQVSEHQILISGGLQPTLSNKATGEVRIFDTIKQAFSNSESTPMKETDTFQMSEAVYADGPTVYLIGDKGGVHTYDLFNKEWKYTNI